MTHSSVWPHGRSRFQTQVGWTPTAGVLYLERRPLGYLAVADGEEAGSPLVSVREGETGTISPCLIPGRGSEAQLPRVPEQ